MNKIYYIMWAIYLMTVICIKLILPNFTYFGIFNARFSASITLKSCENKTFEWKTVNVWRIVIIFCLYANKLTRYRGFRGVCRCTRHPWPINLSLYSYANVRVMTVCNTLMRRGVSELWFSFFITRDGCTVSLILLHFSIIIYYYLEKTISPWFDENCPQIKYI